MVWLSFVLLSASFNVSPLFATSDALSDADREVFEQNDIVFYKPNGNCTTTATSTKVTVTGNNITWIGDSLSGIAGEELMNEMFPGTDYGETYNSTSINDYIRSGKSISTDSGGPSALDILDNIVKQNKLRKYLVFAVGANYPQWNLQSEDNINRFLELIGNDTQVVILTTKTIPPHSGANGGYDDNNKFLKELGGKHANITIGDWAAAVKDEYYISDGLHYTTEGYRAYFTFIKETLATVGGTGSGSSSGSSSGASVIGNNKNYAGDTVWTEEQLKVIHENQSVYEAAAAESGVPWQAIATMHSLETSLAKSNPANGQGLYQLYMYTAGGTNDKAFLPAGPVSDEEFLRQTKIAANEMKQIIEGDHLDPSSDEGIKDLLFQYNGKAQQYIDKAKALGFSDADAKIGEGSPYVMNRYDARRDPNSSEMDPAWPGRFVADGVYDSSSTQYDFGGFVKYIALTGGSVSHTYTGCGTSGSYIGGNGDLSKTAVELAWPVEERSKSSSSPTSNYSAAIKATWTSGYEKSVADAGGFQNDGLGMWVPVGKSCDNFVGTVVRASGIDPEFPVWLGNQKEYLVSSDKWEEVEVNDSSQARAGDIRIENSGGHIVMTAEKDGKLYIASASAGDRFGDLNDWYYKPGVTYRYKGN